jgi:hypothetical protein
LEAHACSSFLLDWEGKLEVLITVNDHRETVNVMDLGSHAIVHGMPLEVGYAEGGSPVFFPDRKALVEGALAGSENTLGNTLRYEPLDGSSPHFLIEPTHHTIVDFSWSPSGNKLGVLQLRKSPDVVLIKDGAG